MKVIARPQNENIKRVNEIYQVLKKNYFGYLIEENNFFQKFPVYFFKVCKCTHKNNERGESLDFF